MSTVLVKVACRQTIITMSDCILLEFRAAGLQASPKGYAPCRSSEANHNAWPSIPTGAEAWRTSLTGMKLSALLKHKHSLNPAESPPPGWWSGQLPGLSPEPSQQGLPPLDPSWVLPLKS